MRKLRLAISSIIFLALILSLYFSIVNTDFFRIVTHTQFFSLFTTLFFSKLIIFSVGFIILVFLTLMFGRFYCSFICPLGILQDIILFIKKLFVKKNFYKYSKSYSILRYAIFIICIFTAAFGTFFVISLLEPFTVFLRIYSVFVLPLRTFINNIIVHSNTSFIVQKYTLITLPIIITAVSSLIIITVMVFLRGRIYCNTLCPVGAFLAYISMHSKNGIVLSKNCKHCRKCEAVCKSECIDSKNLKVDNERCVMCGDCLTVCNYSSISYKKLNNNTAENRKTFIKYSFSILGAFTLGEVFGKIIKPKLKRKSFILPPGAKSVNQFSEKCTACYSCVASCPSKVITPSIENNLRPIMKYDIGFCNYECQNCLTACPTGAIEQTDIDTKKRTQMGRAVFERDKCIVITKNEDCGACSEHCPTKAVTMIYEGNLLLPKTQDHICIGCGACEYACPSFPKKSIHVVPLEEQKIIAVTLLKETQEQTETLKVNNDFPF